MAISRSSNIALFVNRLSASNISLTLVPNVGRSVGKHPHLSSSSNEAHPLRNLLCHSNADHRCTTALRIFTLTLIILNISVGVFANSTHSAQTFTPLLF